MCGRGTYYSRCKDRNCPGSMVSVCHPWDLVAYILYEFGVAYETSCNAHTRPGKLAYAGTSIKYSVVCAKASAFSFSTHHGLVCYAAVSPSERLGWQ